MVSPNETGDSALDSWDGTNNGSHGSRQSHNNVRKTHSSRSRLNKPSNTNASKNILKNSSSANNPKADISNLTDLSKMQPNYQSTPYGNHNNNSSSGAFSSSQSNLKGQLQHLEVNLFKDKENDSFGFSITNSRNGVIVNTVVPNGCADQAGMRSNDLLLFLNQTDISGLSASEIMPKMVKTGRELHLIIARVINLNEYTNYNDNQNTIEVAVSASPNQTNLTRSSIKNNNNTSKKINNPSSSKLTAITTTNQTNKDSSVSSATTTGQTVRKNSSLKKK